MDSVNIGPQQGDIRAQIPFASIKALFPRATDAAAPARPTKLRPQISWLIPVTPLLPFPVLRTFRTATWSLLDPCHRLFETAKDSTPGGLTFARSHAFH